MAKYLKPLGNKVIVRLDPIPGASAGGIILPDNAKNRRPRTGEVLAVNETWEIGGKSVPAQLKQGDKICVLEFGGHEYELNPGDKIHVYNSEDVLGVIVEGRP